MPSSPSTPSADPTRAAADINFVFATISGALPLMRDPEAPRADGPETSPSDPEVAKNSASTSALAEAVRRSIRDDADDSLRRSKEAKGSNADAGPASKRATAADAAARSAANADVSSNFDSDIAGTTAESYDDGILARARKETGNPGSTTQSCFSNVTVSYTHLTLPTIYSV